MTPNEKTLVRVDAMGNMKARVTKERSRAATNPAHRAAERRGGREDPNSRTNPTARMWTEAMIR